MSSISILLNLVDAGQNPLNRGLASVVPTAQLQGSAPLPGIVDQSPVSAQFAGSASPYPSVSILPTDTPGVLPADWAYTISFASVPGNPASWSFYAPAGPVACSLTHASPGVWSYASDAWANLPGGLPAGAGVSVPAAGGFESGTVYFTVNVTSVSFELSLTPGGTPLASTAAGSGLSVSVVSFYLSSLPVN